MTRAIAVREGLVLIGAFNASERNEDGGAASGFLRWHVADDGEEVQAPGGLPQACVGF